MRRIITRFGELMSRKELAIYAIYGDNVRGSEKYGFVSWWWCLIVFLCFKTTPPTSWPWPDIDYNWLKWNLITRVVIVLITRVVIVDSRYLETQWDVWIFRGRLRAQANACVLQSSILPRVQYQSNRNPNYQILSLYTEHPDRKCVYTIHCIPTWLGDFLEGEKSG